MGTEHEQTMTPGSVIRIQRITREMVQQDRSSLFVFGDNMIGRGLKGQAAAMRGEPNVVGVPTKWRPERGESAYFKDSDIDDPDVRHAIMEAFEKMRQALNAGRNVVIPKDGLGTGLAELPTRAPRIHVWIENTIAELSTVSNSPPRII